MAIDGVRLFGGGEYENNADKVSGYKAFDEGDFVFKLEPGAFGGKTNEDYHNQSVFVSDWDA